MHAVREAKFLMLLSCAEGLARDLARATRGAMIQMGWTGRVSQGLSTQATHLTVSSL